VIAKLLAIAVIAILIMVSCKREEFDFNSGPGKIQTTGTISVPSNVDQTGWKIQSGLNNGSVSKGSFKIKLNENAVQLVSILDKNDLPILMSVNATKSQTSNNIISPASTAEALVLLNPFFCTSDLTEVSELKQKITALSSFNFLTNTISSELQNGSFSISETNINLISALDSVYKDLTSQFNNSKSSLIKSSLDFNPSPDFEVNGLKIIEVQKTTTELSFKIANRAKRWISVYVDKSTDGRNFVKSSVPVDLIPSPNISIWDLVFHGKLILPENSNVIQNNTTGYQTFAVKCYGLGVLNNITDEEFSRAILPACASGVFDIAVPVFEVVSGFPFSAELRGRPANHPFYKLVEKAVFDVLKDNILKGRYITWYREGDVVKIVVETSKSIFTTCISNPSLVAQILTNMIGHEVARSMVNSVFYPIRLINATITAANLGYTLGSVLSTEAVTDFKLDNTTVTLPVNVKGVVKSFSNSNLVSGASVTSYDENGVLQQVVVSDASGNYSIKSKTGYLKIRVVANGYKPTNQVFQIASDVISQIPPNYYAPTTWLSDYSGETGNIGGFVKDATNLNPISSVKIELRPGTNDISREIVQQVLSGTNGSFTFTDISSGTYTAFFSKTGYISDYLVLSVLGGQTTSGFNMNLSPDIHTTSGYRVVLTWAQNPVDLDSHLFTPLINGTMYHIYYSNRGDLINPPYANLDVDDVSSYGPETVTIAKTVTGDYFYSVYHFNGSGSLTTSNATINLYGVNGFIRSWSVPTTGDGRWWNVFSINGTTGNITNINQISSSPPAGYKGMVEIDMKDKK